MAQSFTVAFDIGNTLIDVDGIQDRALQSTTDALVERHLIGSRSDFLDAYASVEKSISGPAVNHLFSKPMEIMKRTLDSIELSGRSSLYFALSVYRDTVLRAIEPKSDLTQMLKDMRAKHRLAIVSDGSIDDQILTLYRMGIIELFDPIVISEEVGVLKPDPRIFERLLFETGMSASDVVMVGNDPYRDIAGAKRVGMKTVWVRTGRRLNSAEIDLPGDGSIDFDQLHLLGPVIDRILGEES
ncbi:HAD-IA family hydrolase [Nocardia sp. NPDC050710]|uniref:HAD family hydrolase n=1 Tax=Nocardia sp. NPDC050710 TaxID=3157220 RepID=UPI0033F3C78C